MHPNVLTFTGVPTSACAPDAKLNAAAQTRPATDAINAQDPLTAWVPIFTITSVVLDPSAQSPECTRGHPSVGRACDESIKDLFGCSEKLADQIQKANLIRV